MFDSTLTSVDIYSNNYHDKSFACGINCNIFNNEAMAMTGTSCQQMQLYLEHNNSMPLPSGSTATATTFSSTNNTLISLIYDAIVVIYVTGSVSLVK